MASFALSNALAVSIGRQSLSQASRVSGCVVVQRRDASNSAVPTNLGAMKRGSGGRSSFSGIVATVFGASGYLGRYVCNRLGKIGSQIIIPYRSDAYEMERLRMTGDLGQVLFFPFHLKDEDSIRKVVKYSNVVINLVGRNFETKNFSYDEVHVQGARRIAKLAKEAGVERFIHMSHLNARQDIQTIWKTSQFLKTKYESEMAVREEFPEAIIFKPSDMFGSEDEFLNYYNYRSRWSSLPPGIPLWKKGEQTIKQPVYVADVAEGIIQAIRNPGMEGKSIECVGPQRYYLADIVDYILRILRREDGIRRTDRTIMLRIKAMLVDMIPTHSWFSPDKLEREFITDWTTPGNPTLEDLGVNLTQFDVMARFILFRYRKNAYYAEKFGEFAEPAPPLPAEHYISKRASVTPS